LTLFVESSLTTAYGHFSHFALAALEERESVPLGIKPATGPPAAMTCAGNTMILLPG